MKKTKTLCEVFTPKWITSKDSISTTHKTSFNGFDIEVVNFPGTKTISWQVSWGEKFNASDEDRYEHTVKSVKKKAIEHARKLSTLKP